MWLYKKYIESVNVKEDVLFGCRFYSLLLFILVFGFGVGEDGCRGKFLIWIENFFNYYC